jgi:hypothetical protein
MRPALALLTGSLLTLLIGCGQEYHRNQIAGVYSELPPGSVDADRDVDTIVPTPTRFPGVESDVAGGYTTMRINRWKYQEQSGNRWPSDQVVKGDWSSPGVVSANREYDDLVRTIKRIQEALAASGPDELTQAERHKILTSVRGICDALTKLTENDAAFDRAQRIDARAAIWGLTASPVTALDQAFTTFRNLPEVQLLATAGGAEPQSLGKAISWIVSTQRDRRPSEMAPAIRLASVQLDRWENFHTALLAGDSLTPAQRARVFTATIRLRTALITLAATWSSEFRHHESDSDVQTVRPLPMVYP